MCGHPSFFLPIPQWVFMLILGLIALLARICYPMTIFLAKFRLFHQFFTLLRGQNLIFRLFTSKTLFVLQNPSFWCATWVYCISFNIFIKKGLGCTLTPSKKGSKSYMSAAVLHSLFPIPQKSFMPNLVLVTRFAGFGQCMINSMPSIQNYPRGWGEGENTDFTL